MTNTAVIGHYRYDGLDRLAVYTSLASTNVQRFYNDNQLVTELSGAEPRSLLHSTSEFLALKTPASTTLTSTDKNKSVIHTQTAGQTTDLAYTPYGHHQAPSVLPGLPGFNAEQPDPLTGHYLLGNGYRAYNPVLMRFNSPDSLSPFGKGGLNAYAYCAGDPVNRRDPTGHMPLLLPRGRITSRVARNAGDVLPIIEPVSDRMPTLKELAIGKIIEKTKPHNTTPKELAIRKIIEIKKLPNTLPKPLKADIEAHASFELHKEKFSAALGEIPNDLGKLLPDSERFDLTDLGYNIDRKLHTAIIRQQAFRKKHKIHLNGLHPDKGPLRNRWSDFILFESRLRRSGQLRHPVLRI